MTEITKQVRIPFNNLPEINSNTGGYYIRYRVISEDRNRSSHWSPIQIADPGLEVLPTGNLIAESGTGYINLIWNPVSLQVGDSFVAPAESYDVWINWNDQDQADWTYIERVRGTATTVIVPTDYKINGVDQGTPPSQASIEVYVKGSPIQRNDGAPGQEGTLILKAYQLIDFQL